MSDLYVTCRRCSGWGSIETSQSEDGRFSYQDQCPECSSHGVVPASPADILAAVRTLPGVEEIEAIAHNNGVGPLNRPWVTVPGRYLVVPLSEEE